MEKDLDPVVIKATQAALGKYVKRPPLTEKLLKKPPFRFLHDIVTSVLKTTGFFNGLFDEEELVSDNVKDRENKIVFLNKVITVVGLTTGKTLGAKPSKIVAGQEPEKTNELLQCIAQALDKNLSSDEAVKKFKDGAKLSKPDEKEKRTKDSTKQSKKATEPSKLTSKSSEKLTNKKKESGVRSSKNENEKTDTNKSKQKEKSSTKNESPPKKTSQNSKLVASKKPSVDKKITENNENNTDMKDGGIEKNALTNSDAIIDKTDSRLDIKNQAKEDVEELTKHSETVLIQQSKENNLDNSYTTVENGLNSSLSSQDLMENENVKSGEHNIIDEDNTVYIENKQPNEQNIANGNIDDSMVDNDKLKELPINNKISSNSSTNDFNKKEESNNDVPLIKPSSEVKAIVRPLSVRPSSSRPGAPRPRDKHDNLITEAENVLVGKVNIITESSPNEEDEDASIVIVEQESSNAQALQDEREKLEASINEHGHLVQQILDSQKEYSQMSGKTEIEWQFGAQKARDALNKEIEQLRFDIQALSRVANPLGKVLDHIQEDVEVMRQELNQWTKTYEETSKELLKQKAANEDSLYPLYAKVKQLGTDIEEKHDKINDLKIIIYKNSHRIDKLLTNGSVQ